MVVIIKAMTKTNVHTHSHIMLMSNTCDIEHLQCS